MLGFGLVRLRIGCLLVGLLAAARLVALSADGRWPSLDAQLHAAAAPKGSALETLIAANQDFSVLRPEELDDDIPLPLWLRVHWRRAHPEGVYSARDPAGGYPLALREAYEWMRSHPDLEPGGPSASSAREPEPETPSSAKIAGIGSNLRISGAQLGSRAESDIRIDPWHQARVVAAANGSGPQAMFYSTNFGASWGQSSLPLQPGDAFHSDPAVEWTSDGTAWSTTIGIDRDVTTLELRAYRSIDGGATWSFDATFSGLSTVADKELIWVDHSALSPYQDQLYAIWHDNFATMVARRTGPGGRGRRRCR